MLAAVFYTVALKDTLAIKLWPGWDLNQRSALIAVASPNWLFIPSVNRGQTTVLPDDNVGDAGRIVNQNGLWASWARSFCMNNSPAAEFSCVCGSMQ